MRNGCSACRIFGISWHNRARPSMRPKLSLVQRRFRFMPNNLSHFAIPADDVERARRFYERVFKWRIEAWGPPDFYLIFTDDAGQPHGSIDKRDDLAAARREQPVKGRGGI